MWPELKENVGVDRAYLSCYSCHGEYKVYQGLESPDQKMKASLAKMKVSLSFVNLEFMF